MPTPHNHRAGERPALLILPLTNGHLMVSQVNRTDVRTLATLNRWYPNFIDALALVQKGNLDVMAGHGVVALHRDCDEPWHEQQPRFFRDPVDMGRWAKELKISRLFWHSLAVDDAENGQPESQPKKSTKLTISKEWTELWLTR